MEFEDDIREVEVTLSLQSIRLLDTLAERGIYGIDRAEVAARFIDEALKRLVGPVEFTICRHGDYDWCGVEDDYAVRIADQFQRGPRRLPRSRLDRRPRRRS